MNFFEASIVNERTMKKLIALAIVLATLAPAVGAQTAATSFTGKWEGTFTRQRSDGTPEVEKVVFNLTHKGKELTGTAGPPDRQWPIEKGTVDAGKALAEGIQGITSVMLFLTFTAFSTFFLLKDGPVVRRWIDRNMGIPVDIAQTVTGNVITSLRRYFLGVTAVAVFNGIVVGLGALLLGVPLWGTIAVVTFSLAYIPYIGAFVSGAFAVLLTLASQGTTDALIMLVIVLLANGLLQNIIQPIAFGATLKLNPLVILIVTIGFGSIFGALGMILAAPLTSAAVHISSELAQAKASEAAGAAGPEPPAPKPALPLARA